MLSEFDWLSVVILVAVLANLVLSLLDDRKMQHGAWLWTAAEVTVFSVLGLSTLCWSLFGFFWEMKVSLPWLLFLSIVVLAVRRALNVRKLPHSLHLHAVLFRAVLFAVPVLFVFVCGLPGLVSFEKYYSERTIDGRVRTLAAEFRKVQELGLGHLMMAQRAELAQQLDESLLEYSGALRTSRLQTAYLLSERANVKFLLGQYEEALKDYREADNCLKKSPGRSIATTLCYLWLGKKTEAGHELESCSLECSESMTPLERTLVKLLQCDGTVMASSAEEGLSRAEKGSLYYYAAEKTLASAQYDLSSNYVATFVELTGTNTDRARRLLALLDPAVTGGRPATAEKPRNPER